MAKFKDHSMSELHAHTERQKRSEWRVERSDAELEAIKLLLRERLRKLKRSK